MRIFLTINLIILFLISGCFIGRKKQPVPQKPIIGETLAPDHAIIEGVFLSSNKVDQGKFKSIIVLEKIKQTGSAFKAPISGGDTLEIISTHNLDFKAGDKITIEISQNLTLGDKIDFYFIKTIKQ